jgi:hypothetical protein
VAKVTAILSWLASLITSPILGKALDAYKAKLAAGNTSEGVAADLASKEILLQQREANFKRSTASRRSATGTNPTRSWATRSRSTSPNF